MKEDPFVGVYRALSPKELAEKFMNPNDPKTEARALSPKELAEKFMNPNDPKTEAEHWAVREIEKLRAEVERLREVIRTIRARCVEMDDSDAVSETLDISSAALEDEPRACSISPPAARRFRTPCGSLTIGTTP